MKGIDSIIYADLDAEIAACNSKYGAFNSTHEGLGVITEEIYELLSAVKANNPIAIQIESIQVAAACLRLADECFQGDSEFNSRSGFDATGL